VRTSWGHSSRIPLRHPPLLVLYLASLLLPPCVLQVAASRTSGHGHALLSRVGLECVNILPGRPLQEWCKQLVWSRSACVLSQAVTYGTARLFQAYNQA
jgi:hypothetical protein